MEFESSSDYDKELTKLIESIESDKRAEEENKPCGLSLNEMMKEFNQWTLKTLYTDCAQ